MRACFDTGSANAWILSSQCTSYRCQEGSQNMFFDPFSSYTFENTSEWTSIQFGSGALRGYFGIDDFRLGQGKDELHIKEQTIGLMVEEHVLDPDYDAIIGLAYPEMANVGLPIFDSMMK
jgi:Eukaryotic aspartyl protease